MESSQLLNGNNLFCSKVSFLTDHHCQFRGVCQSMKEIQLYLWYHLFHAQWDAINNVIKIIEWNDIIYITTWNWRIGLASFRFSWEDLIWSLPHTNKGTSQREKEHSLYPYVFRLSVDIHVHQTSQICCQSKTRIFWWYQLQRTCLKNQSGCFFFFSFIAKLDSSLPKTRYLYLRWTNFFIKQSWIIILICPIALSGGIVV